MLARFAIVCALGSSWASTCQSDCEAESMLAIRSASEAAADHSEQGTVFPQWKIKQFFLTEKRNMTQVALRRLSQSQKNCQSKRGYHRVLVAAGPRTGSTSLLTIANTLLFFCDAKYDPVQESDPFPESDPDGKNFPWQSFAGARSSALKVHEAKGSMIKKYPTIVLTTHRQPDEQLASIWSHWYRNQPCKHPPCKSWTTAQREMERQACLYESFGHRVKYDMPLQDLIDEPGAVVRHVSKALGIDIDDELTRHVLNIYNKARRSIRSSDQKRENVFIQMDADDDDAEATRYGTATASFQKSVMYAVEEGSKTVEPKNWLNGKGTIDANPLWNATASKMDQKIKTFTNWDWCRGWKALSTN